MPRLVILLALFLVNLPAVHQAWTGHQIDRDGRDVQATVLEARTVDGRHFVDYRLPADVDPDGTPFSSRVDAATLARAEETDRLPVRVVPGRPGANRPDGEVSSSLFLVAAISADAILLVAAGLWLYRRRTRAGDDPLSRPGG